MPPPRGDEGAAERGRSHESRMADRLQHAVDGVRECERSMAASQARDRLTMVRDDLDAALEAMQDSTTQRRRELTELLRGMRHEVLSAAGGGHGLVRTLLDADLPPEQLADHVQTILDALDQAVVGIQDGVDLVLARTGALETHPKSLDVREQVAAVAAGLAAEAERRGVLLKAQVPEDPGDFVCDPDHLRAVLTPLVAAACRGSSDGSRVVLRVRIEEEDLVFEVEDRGAPLAEAAIEALFTPFEPPADRDARRRVLSGASLPAARALAHALGGEMGGRSSGDGNRFWARIPRQAPERIEPERVARRGGGPKVLVVEDDSGDRERLQEILEEAGYEVRTASDAVRAEKLVKSERFAAVTLDLMLGRTFSSGILESLRTRGPNRRTPVIVLSVASPGQVQLTYPIQGHLQKPVRAKAVLRALQWVGVPPPAQGPVLLISQDDEQAEEMQKIVDETDRKLLMAANVRQARRLIEQRSPVVIVADASAPGIDREFLEPLSGVVVVHADAEDRKRLAGTGARFVPADGSLRDELEKILSEMGHVLEGGGREAS